MGERRMSSVDHPDLEQLRIEISASDATEEDIDRMTRQLLSELRETDVESADLAKGGVLPRGTKSGDAVTIGSIVISALPAVLPVVVGLVQAWAARGHGRTVKFKGSIGGGMVEFEGSPEQLQNLLETIEVRSAAKENQLAEKTDESGGDTKEDSDRVEQTPPVNKPARSPRIFISYRRADSADITGRIYDRLAGHFGESAIFKDVDSIPPGVDFKEHLEKAVGKCKVFLAVIGERWLEATDSLQNNRLQDPRDFVRIELEAALDRKILVVPLLVRGASMPEEENLPPSLRKLVYRNAISVRSDPDFHRDMDRLIAAIASYSVRRS